MIGALAIVGWHFAVPALVSVPITATPLRYNAALGFLLLGVATFTLSLPRPRVACAFASLATLLGAATTLQYVLGVDVGVDTLIFTGPQRMGPRMAPNAAFGILIAGAVLLTCACVRITRAAAVTAAAGALLFSTGTIAGFGYVVGLPTTYTWAGLTPLSALGAMSLCLQGAALFSLAWAESRHSEPGLPSWSPIVATVGGVAVSVLAWVAIVAAQYGNTAEAAAVAAALPWIIFLVMLLLALVVGALTHMLIKQARQARELALEVRTREWAQAEAKRQEALLRATLDVLPVGVFIADRDGHIHTTNQSGRELWGGTCNLRLDEYAQYKAWWPATGQRLQEHEWALARAVMQGETVLGDVLNIETFTGMRKTITTSAVPLRENEVVTGAVAIAQDISARVHAEKALAQRTADLERSNADLEQFAYVASHDLQEPLRMIASFTQLLQRRYQGKLDAGADEYIEFVVDGAQRMQRLLHDLLEYSRVGSRGRTLLAMSARDAVDDALANLRVTLQESDTTIDVEPLPHVMADRGQLAQVFQNLLANALKFRSAERPLRVRVSGTRRGAMVELSVHDNGIGIEARHAERISSSFSAWIGAAAIRALASAWPFANAS